MRKIVVLIIFTFISFGAKASNPRDFLLRGKNEIKAMLSKETTVTLLQRDPRLLHPEVESNALIYKNLKWKNSIIRFNFNPTTSKCVQITISAALEHVTKAITMINNEKALKIADNRWLSADNNYEISLIILSDTFQVSYASLNPKS